jgi:hypothetical protein
MASSPRTAVLPLALLLAGSAPVDLHWEAPPECPDAAEIERRIAAYTGSAEPDEPLVVDAKVEQVDARWRLRLALTRGASEELRELEDGACEGLAESAAVLVAIAIAPELMGEAEVPPPQPPEPPTAPIEPPPTTHAIETPPPPPPPARRREPLHVSLRASGGASVGWLPIGGDVALAFALWWRWLRLELVGSYAPPRRVRFDDLQRAGADVSAWAVGVRACGLLHPVRWLDIPLCGGVEAGQLIGRPVQLVDGKIGRPAWAAGVIAPALAFVVHRRVALWLAPELLIPFTRPTLRLTNEDAPLFQAARVAGRFSAGIELRFR